MRVQPSRLVLVLSLAVLGSSLGVFGAVSGLASPGTHELVITDGALVANDGGQQRTLVADVRAVDRIEVSRTDGYRVVRTVPREPARADAATRRRAKSVVTSAATVGDDIDVTDAAYTVWRIPRPLASDRAAVVGATTNASLRDALGPDPDAFDVRVDETTDTVVFERTAPQRSEDRVLVVVTPNASGTRYSAVVNLRTETVESLVRLDRR